MADVIKDRLLLFIQEALAACTEVSGPSGEPNVFLVAIHPKGSSPVNRVEVLADTDAGISIAECLSVNRCLNSAIEADEEMRRLVGEDFELTVSSPGIGAPLQHVRQYVRHTGHLLRVQYRGGDADALHEVSGRLLQAEVLEVSSPFIVLEPVKAGKGRKGVRLEPIRLELNCIDRAVVEVEF